MAGWLTGITQRLTDRHRPCRRAVDELSTLVTAERDRQRQARADIGLLIAMSSILHPDAIRRRLIEIGDTLEGPAPTPLTSPHLSNPPAPTNPSPGDR